MHHIKVGPSKAALNGGGDWQAEVTCACGWTTTAAAASQRAATNAAHRLGTDHVSAPEQPSQATIQPDMFAVQAVTQPTTLGHSGTGSATLAIGLLIAIGFVVCVVAGFVLGSSDGDGATLVGSLLMGLGGCFWFVALTALGVSLGLRHHSDR
ncbi:hypothetical protein [Nocardioides ultimimeridianus]